MYQEKNWVLLTLSRVPVPDSANQDFQSHVSAYVEEILNSSSKEKLQQIHQEQEEDEIFRQLKHYCQNGWPRNDQILYASHDWT